eukprot:scaffold304928_cov14-Tisochrysis_lutea.AAC.1
MHNQRRRQSIAWLATFGQRGKLSGSQGVDQSPCVGANLMHALCKSPSRCTHITGPPGCNTGCTPKNLAAAASSDTNSCANGSRAQTWAHIQVRELTPKPLNSY